MNGYNFTDRVRKVLAIAREEAARLRHEYVGTEHILLGLINEGAGVATAVLANLGVDLDALHDKIDETVKKGKNDAVGPDLPYTSRAKKVLELAMSQARELNHSYVGTEHLLLGLLAERKGIGAQVLTHFGVTLQNATVETVNILGSERRPSEQESRVRRAAQSGGIAAVEAPQLSDRFRDVMRDAEDAATEFGANDLMPIHIAIALARNGEGFANALLDRLNIDRSALIRALTNEAKSDDPASIAESKLTIGQFTVVWQRQAESESLRRRSPLTTLNILLALLDTVKSIAVIFEAQGIHADRVRAEARRMSG